MSRHEIVEIAVQEVLDPMIRGQQVVLGAEEQSLLATWAYHDCRRLLSAQPPLPAVVVRFVRALRTTCSRGSGPPVDQRGQVFTWAVMDPQDRHRDR
jgi:hypothetical protein